MVRPQSLCVARLVAKPPSNMLSVSQGRLSCGNFTCCHSETEVADQTCYVSRGQYHGGRRPSSDDSFHSPTVIPPSALDKPSIMTRYYRRQTTRWGVTARSPTVVTLHDTGFVECRWWNVGWTVKTRHLTVVGLHDTGPWSKYTDTRPSSPSTDPRAPGVRQRSR